MSKEKILDIIEAAKREFPSTWESVALDWLHDWYAEKGSHLTREQVRKIVWYVAGVAL